MGKRAFTLVELIIGIVLLGILAYVGTNLLLPLMEGYISTRQQTFLFNEAQFAVDRMAHELRNAIPNSIRIGQGYIQFCKFDQSAYYVLVNADNFTFYGGLGNIATGDNVSIYNTAPDYLYSLERVYTVVARNGNMVQVNKPIDPSSPYHRVYLISTPVTFYLKNGKIYRSFAYPIDSTIYGIDRGKFYELADFVDSVSFSYSPGNYRHSAVVTIRVTLKKGSDRLSYSQEVHIRNVP